MVRSESSTRRSTFRRLLAAMLTFGAGVGMLFPLFAWKVLGSDQALSVEFWSACIGAGLAVGLANYLLFHIVVSRNLKRVADAMGRVLDRVRSSEAGAAQCDESCRLGVSSADAIGEMETAFDHMTDAVSQRLRVEVSSRALLEELARSDDMADLSDRLLHALEEASGARAGALYVVSQDALTLAASRGLDRGPLCDRLERSTHGLAWRVLDAPALTVIQPDEAGLEACTVSSPLGSYRPRNLVMIPLEAQGQVVGLAILAGPSVPSESVLEVLEALRSHAGPNLHMALLREKLRKLAAIDDLTGLLNRRFGLRRFEEEFSRSVRHGTPLGVMLLDLDHFKRLNDNYGHDAGDMVLRRVGAVLTEATRAGDVVCRYGGEEFLIVAPGTSLADVEVLADRVRRAVETLELPWAAHRLEATISVGIAGWPLVAVSTAAELITRADGALYRAKARGRNCVARAEAKVGEDRAHEPAA